MASIYAQRTVRVAAQIQRRGCQVTWTKTPISIPDATKAWLAGSSAPQVFNPYVVFIPSNKKNWYATIFDANADIPDGFIMAIMAGNCGFVPMLTDALTDPSGNHYFVKWIDKVAPDGTPILWTLGLAP